MFTVKKFTTNAQFNHRQGGPGENVGVSGLETRGNLTGPVTSWSRLLRCPRGGPTLGQGQRRQPFRSLAWETIPDKVGLGLGLTQVIHKRAGGGATKA